MNPWRERYPYSDKFYEAQPYLYSFAGLVVMIWLRNTAAIASGLILISAGLAVRYMRFRYRREFKESRGHIEIPENIRNESSSPTVAELNWNDSFSCGHPVIDAQHRRLFGLCNVIIDRIGRNASDLEVERELAEIVAHIEEHFLTEEAILARTKHPLSAEHQAHHAKLLEGVKRLSKQFSVNAVGKDEVVRFIAYEVIAGHISEEDLKWAVATR